MDSRNRTTGYIAKTARSGAMNDDGHCTCPQRRRIEKHDEQNEEIWNSEEWKRRKEQFLRENPACCSCGGISQVPHHPDLEVYGKPEYLDLSNTRPYCNRCHRGLHRGLFRCPDCGKIVSRYEGEKCFGCLEKCDQERLKSGRTARNDAKNKANRTAYRRCHPKKEVNLKTGKWEVKR